MKKLFLFSLVLVAFCACKTEKPVSPTPETPSVGMIQQLNPDGTLTEGLYNRLFYYITYGPDFQSAYTQLESKITNWKEEKQRLAELDSNWDAEKTEVRLVSCPVYGTHNDDLEYISVDIYGYYIPEADYRLVMYCVVIDSEGNVYVRGCAEWAFREWLN